MRKLGIKLWARTGMAVCGLMLATSAQAGGPACCAPVSDCCETSCCAPDDCCATTCDEVVGGCCDTVVDDCCEAAECCDGGDGCCGDDCCDSGCGSCDWCDLGDPWTLQGALCNKGDDCCDASDCCDGGGGCLEGFTYGGWIQAGYTNRSTGLFNSRPDAFNWHQVWVYAEKVADGSDGIGFGGRVDFLYGQDAGDTQSFGNEPGNFDFANGFDRGAQYGFALPQLYAEIAAGDLSVKVGHFYTLLGYEVVQAPDNFFFSHAYTQFNSEAFTHTGALATYAVNDDLTVYAGWTLGWDTGFDQFSLGGQNGSNFLGGFSTAIGDNTTFTYITTFGDLGFIGDGYSHSMVFDVAVTDKLNYVFQSDILEVDLPFNAGHAETVGINQYLLYSINDCLGVGGRFEWWKADSDSVYAITGGVNIRPKANLVIRPEIRYQWDPGANQGVIASEGDAIFGVDAIITF